MKTNGTSKSLDEVNFYLELYRKMFVDLTRRFPSISKSLSRDLSTIVERTGSEGIQFLTITLPKVGKYLDKKLMAIPDNTLDGFAMQTVSGIGIYPKFLSGLFGMVLGAQGEPLPDLNVEALASIRQVAYLAYKLDFPYSPDLEKQKLDEFVRIEEEELANGCANASSHLLAEARLLLWDVFRNFDPKDIIPGHGPGAVAGGQTLEEKWVFTHLYSKVDRLFPYADYFACGSDMLEDTKDLYSSLIRDQVPVAKVALVPKDSRGPRIISIEPAEMQYLQQGVMKSLVPYIETHPRTKGHVNFTDQTVNQTLALESSVTREWATIDMKDASDRVSEELVYYLFNEVPDLRKVLLALRSTATKLPDGRTVKLRKYAPMGSALCFPVEALCFWCICFAALRNEGLSRSQALESVYVYGDDIIVPTKYALQVIQLLEYFGLKANLDKCCISGYFRESCGVDAYEGTDVTPIRLKRRWNPRPTSAEVFLHYVEFANHLHLRGYASLAQHLWSKIQETYGLLPYAPELGYYPCRVDVSSWQEAFIKNASLFKFRVNTSCQHLEMYVNVSVQKSRPVHFKNDWHRLMRDLTVGCGDKPDVVFIPRMNRIRRRWVRVPDPHPNVI